MSRISVHLRVTHSLYDTLLEALELKRSFLQCFLLSHPEQHHLIISRNQQAAILELVYIHNLKLYIHAPYWVNLCSDDVFQTKHILHAEVNKARSLGAYAYVMHLGYSTHTSAKYIKHYLSYLTDQFPTMQFILENSFAYKNNQGVYLSEFAHIFSSLSHNIFFCLDTAHIYSAGYDINQHSEYDRLMNDIERSIGYSNVALIHCNNTLQPIGSVQDIHSFPDSGLIKKEVLKQLINNQHFKKVPIILELPYCSMSEYKIFLKQVESWIENAPLI